MMISPKLLRVLGVVLGFLFLFLATFEFMRSYREGDAKWNYLLMIFGMLLVLFYTLFKKTLVKKK